MSWRPWVKLNSNLLLGRLWGHNSLEISNSWHLEMNWDSSTEMEDLIQGRSSPGCVAERIRSVPTSSTFQSVDCGVFFCSVSLSFICRPITKRRRESNLGRVGAKRERFLCAMPSHHLLWCWLTANQLSPQHQNWLTTRCKASSYTAVKQLSGGWQLKN